MSMRFAGERVALFGDSLAKGICWNEERRRHVTLPVSAADIAAERLGVTIINRARFGFTAPRGLALMERELESSPGYDAAVIEFGGNDCNFDWAAISENPEGTHAPATSPERFFSTVCAMAERLKSARIRPIFVTPPPIDAARYFKFLIGDKLNGSNVLRWLGDVQQIYRFQELYASLVAKAAASTGAALLDVRGSCLSNHALCTLFCADGLHLTEEGQRFLGTEIAKLVLQGETT